MALRFPLSLAVALCAALTTASLPTAAQAPALPVAPAANSPATQPAPSLITLRHLIDTGHAAEALQQLATLRADHSTLAGLSRLEGLADYAEGNLRAADAAFAAALQQDPTDTEAAQMRGLTLFGLGRPADAIPLLEPSRDAMHNTKADPNYVLGLCYMDTRRYDEARHAFAAQYAFSPDSAAAYLVTARMLFRREYTPVAQSYAEKALALEPTLPLAHELLGEIALAGGHYDDAIAQLEQERARNPLEASVYDRLGDAYVRAAHYDQAQRTLEEAILLEPNATGPYILLGKTLLRKGQAVGATTYLEHAERLDPANYMTHSLLGQAYRAMGRTADAEREVQTAQRLQAATEPKITSLH